MAEPDASNEELTRLLRQFGTPTRDAVDDARHAFYNSTVKFFDRQALRATGYNQELAQQAMQEAWIKIARKAGTYDPAKGKVHAWANAIITRCALDQLRAYYRELKLRKALGGADQDSDGRYDGVAAAGAQDGGQAACPVMPADEMVYQEQVARATALCVKALPCDNGPNYRLAMELTLDADLTFAEMTEVIQLQMPHGTVNSEQVRGWVRQAVKRMRACVSARLGWDREGGNHG
jgi:DNA-directed RNA polymerase specialized sigma24 family protein